MQVITRRIPAMRPVPIYRRPGRALWVIFTGLPVGLAILVARADPFRFLPQPAQSRDLAVAFLQAHAALAALTLVFVVLLLQTIQRADYSEVIWQDFLDRSKIREVAAIIFLSIGAEALFVLAMSDRSVDSPWPNTPGISNLVLFVFAGFIVTMAVSFWLAYSSLTLMRASSLWNLAQEAGRHEVKRKIREQALGRIGSNVLREWRQRNHVGQREPASEDWKPTYAQATGRVDDICLSHLEELARNGATFTLEIELGHNVVAGKDVIGRIRDGTEEQMKLLAKSIRVRAQR